MIKLYRATELLFEKITNVATQLFANSIVFILAIVFVIYWLIDRDWHKIDKTDGVRDVILAVTFLSFFIIQRNFNHFSSALHLKVNELVSAHENARNHLIKVEVPGSKAQPQLLTIRVVSESGQDRREQRGLVHMVASGNGICGLRLRLGSLSAAEIPDQWRSVDCSPKFGVMAA